MADTTLHHDSIMTIERHILEEQETHPEATGALTNLLYDLALAERSSPARRRAPAWRRSSGLPAMSISRERR